MKSGHKTSEFWLSMAGILTTILNEQIGLNIDPIALASIMGVIATYIAGRTMAKKGS
jgi:hypothetical protein